MGEEALCLAGLGVWAVLLRAGWDVETQDLLHLEGKLLEGEEEEDVSNSSSMHNKNKVFPLPGSLIFIYVCANCLFSLVSITATFDMLLQSYALLNVANFFQNLCIKYR